MPTWCCWMSRRITWMRTWGALCICACPSTSGLGKPCWTVGDPTKEIVHPSRSQWNGWVSTSTPSQGPASLASPTGAHMWTFRFSRASQSLTGNCSHVTETKATKELRLTSGQ
eukprot:6114833-Amphidinium_carterae.1